MMKIPLLHTDIGAIDDKKIRGPISSMWATLVRAINGGIEFGSPQGQAQKISGNVQGKWPGTLVANYTITTPGVANTEFTVTHNLNRIPTGYDVKSIDAAAHIYDSRKALWTKTQMFLKCDQATVHLVLFVH